MIKEERICLQCGGLIHHNDSYSDEYAGFDLCLCSSMVKKSFLKEKERLFTPGKNLKDMQNWEAE
jgi:hypothetical protein